MAWGFWRLLGVAVHDTYGELTQTSGASQTVFGFTGEETDSNGLVNLRARYYNPTLGLFPSLDMLEGNAGQPMSLNRYGYVQGNVANWVDPSGLCAGNPCNPNDPYRDNACWDIAFQLYVDYGVRINERGPDIVFPALGETWLGWNWYLSDLKSFRKAFDEIATKLGAQDSALGAGIWRYHLGKDHPLILNQATFREILQNTAAGTWPETNTIWIVKGTLTFAPPESILTHEIGHLVQARDGWQARFENAIKNSGEKSASDYGDSGSPLEDFAESWATFVTGSPGSLAGARPLGPIRTTFFNSLVSDWIKQGNILPTFSMYDAQKAYGCVNQPTQAAIPASLVSLLNCGNPATQRSKV